VPVSSFVLVFVLVLLFDCESEPLPDPLFEAGALGPNLFLPRRRRLWRDICIPPRESIPRSLQEPPAEGKITRLAVDLVVGQIRGVAAA
jgi:hypothetical protein